MDYDQTTMPESYDRARKPAEGMLEMWMERTAALLTGHDISMIVDLGCGTGRFTQALAQTFDATVIGIDPSEKMLAQAKAKPTAARVSFATGAGERIPCADASADLIFASMAFHHLSSPRQTAKECRRVLRKGGAVCVRNSTRERSSPYEAYFPNYRHTLDTLPAAQEIIEAFVGNGFTLRHHEAVPHLMAKNVDDLADKAAFRADTTLLRLSDDDFESGIAKMRAAAQAPTAPAIIDIDLFVFARGSED
jgi:ubiquinone/menaquinone biosynthesis C-methylase UbiE